MNLALRYLFIAFLAFQWAIFPALGQTPLTFKNLSVENGLSQNSVMTVAQDSTGFIWLGTRQGFNRYDGYRFKVYKNEEKSSSGLPSGEATALLTDHEGTLWAGTSGGLALYHADKDVFESLKEFSTGGIENIYQDRQNRLWITTLNGLKLLTDKKRRVFRSFRVNDKKDDPVNNIYSIYQDRSGVFWIGTGNGLLIMHYHEGKISFRKIALAGNNDKIYVTSITGDAQHRIWVASSNGLYCFSPDARILKAYLHNDMQPNSIIHNDVREVMFDKKGILWIGTQNGLSLLDPVTGRFIHEQHDPEKPASISQNSIHHLFTDRDGNIWIGTYFGGVNIVYPTATNFSVYRNQKQQHSLSNNVVSTILENDAGYWIGTEGGGLNYFNPETQTFRSYKTNSDDQNSISSNLVKVIEKENQKRLFIGTHRGKINLFDPSTGQFRHIANVKDRNGTITSAEIITLKKDHKGILWVGSVSGLTTLEMKNGNYPDKTSRSPLDDQLKGKAITSLFEDSRNLLWIGTNSGIFCYDSDQQKFHSFSEAGNALTLPSPFINCINENAKGQILIGTRGGFTLFDPEKRTGKTYTETDGLANNNVMGILEDNMHNLWVSTSGGITEFNMSTQHTRNYTKSDGLASNEFNVRACFKDRKGRLFFGGFNGLTAFYPQEIELNNVISPLVFTGLTLFNQPLKVGGEDKILTQAVNLSDKLTFKHDQNQFTLEFSLLNYLKPDKNTYFYKLEGYDKDWIETVIPNVSYSNLPAGNYRFLLKAVNNDGISGQTVRSLQIHVHPAPWASWWAYLIYILILGTILLVTVRYFFVKALLKRTEDLQQMKLQFFTQVSHEIRTPLTLILSPLEALFKTTRHLPGINQQVQRIKSNADRLHFLVTELLDFRKSESGQFKLKLASANLVPFIRQIFQAFEHLAESRNIHYSLSCEQDEIMVWFDRLQLEKVFFNLLSNAFKFTSDSGTIRVSLTQNAQQVVIAVRDNGLGIPEESKDKIFSDFFQVDRVGSTHIGSGIGLALSKSIVTAHGGQLLMESKAETASTEGDTCFTVILRKEQPEGIHTTDTGPGDVNWHSMIPVPLPDIAAQVKHEQTETLLLIEDNSEIRHLLKAFFANDYLITEAENGQEGWENAIQNLPDLIICDVMMPVMNGMELCRKLKTDERTSHIPVIMLTAMDTHTQQVEGLSTGADNYITKPFSTALLNLHVRNLLQSRKIMRRKFSDHIDASPEKNISNPVDKQFIERLTGLIEVKLTDPHFGVPELAREIGMAMPVLYKKVRAVTDLTVNDFMKSVRLKKAENLLKEGIHNVSEIAYLVGFNDPKYFSREFKKQFGKSAKSYQLQPGKQKTANKR